MSVAIDVILVALFVWRVVVGYRKGLTGVLLGIARIVVSVVLAVILGPMIGDAVGDGVLSRVVCYIIVFVLAYVACSIIMFLLKQVKIPLVHATDKLLGIIIGAVFGILSVSLLCAVTYSLLCAVDWVSSSSNALQIYENSYIFKAINEFNIFGFIKDILI